MASANVAARRRAAVSQTQWKRRPDPFPRARTVQAPSLPAALARSLNALPAAERHRNASLVREHLRLIRESIEAAERSLDLCVKADRLTDAMPDELKSLLEGTSGGGACAR